MFITNNCDKENFNIFKELNKINRYIKKLTKETLDDDLSKRLLALEFKSKHSVKSKCLKWIVKKYYLQHKDLKKRATNTNWKRNWSNVLFRA